MPRCDGSRYTASVVGGATSRVGGAGAAGADPSGRRAVDAVGAGRGAARWNYRDRDHLGDLGRYENMAPRLERISIGVAEIAVISTGPWRNARSAHPPTPKLGALLDALADVVRAAGLQHDGPQDEHAMRTAVQNVRLRRDETHQGATRRARLARRRRGGDEPPGPAARTTARIRRRPRASRRDRRRSVAADPMSSSGGDRSRSSRRAVTSALAAVLVLGACGGDQGGPETVTFTSPVYGYSIAHSDTWDAVEASRMLSAGEQPTTSCGATRHRTRRQRARASTMELPGVIIAAQPVANDAARVTTDGLDRRHGRTHEGMCIGPIDATTWTSAASQGRS